MKMRNFLTAVSMICVFGASALPAQAVVMTFEQIQDRDFGPISTYVSLPAPAIPGSENVIFQKFDTNQGTLMSAELSWLSSDSNATFQIYFQQSTTDGMGNFGGTATQSYEYRVHSTLTTVSDDLIVTGSKSASCSGNNNTMPNNCLATFESLDKTPAPGDTLPVAVLGPLNDLQALGSDMFGIDLTVSSALETTLVTNANPNGVHFNTWEGELRLSYIFECDTGGGNACDLIDTDASDGSTISLFVAVPEPGTLALFGLGLAGLGFARKYKRAA